MGTEFDEVMQVCFEWKIQGTNMRFRSKDIMLLDVGISGG